MNEYPQTIDQLDERVTAISKEEIWQGLDELVQTAGRVPWNGKSKGIVFSDGHWGIGDKIDLFTKDQETIFDGVIWTFPNHKIIINGDWHELWLNYSLEDIEKVHGKVAFDHRTSGNHDCELGFPEAIILDGPKPILITHGHKGDWPNDQGWKTGRWIVRHLGRPLEEAGIINPASVSQSQDRHYVVSQALQEWAFDRKHMLICGHTHTALALPPYYWNSGCCIGKGIDAVIIEGCEIELRHFT